MKTLLLCAALVAPAAPARSAEAGAERPTLKSLDARLDEAQAAERELGPFLEGARARLLQPDAPAAGRSEPSKDGPEQDCRARFGAESLPALAKGRWKGRYKGPMLGYLACRALAAASPEPCRADPAYLRVPEGSDESPARLCLEVYHLVRFLDARAAGKDAAGECRDSYGSLVAPELVAKGGGAPAVAALCAEAAGGSCASVEKFPWVLHDRAFCEALMGASRGAARACAKPEPADFTLGVRCKDVAALRAARAGGSCGGSALCGAAVGRSAQACEPLLAQTRDAYCGDQARGGGDGRAQESPRKAPDAKGTGARAAAMEEVKARHRLLDERMRALDAALEAFTPRSEPGLAARVTRGRDIRRRIDDAFRSFRSATEGAGAHAPR